MAFVDQPNKYAGLNAIANALSDAGFHITDDDIMSTYFDVKLGNPGPTQKVLDATPDFLVRWWSLTTLYPSLATSIHLPLLNDITKCTKVYDRILPPKPSTKHFHMTVSTDPDQLSESDEMVPPKVIGGIVWTLNPEYVEIQKNWMNAGFPRINPCIALGWPGVQRKTISGRNHLNDCDTLMFLTTVDYDLDRQDTFDSSFAYAMNVSRRCLTEGDPKMQSTALTGLLSLDIQVYIRKLQESWIVYGAPGGNLGPEDISPSDWVCTVIGDSGVTGACGYEDQKYYKKSRPGIFTAVSLANMHDTIYDIATSNRISSGLYAGGAGIAETNLHSAFITAMVDGIAHRVLSLSPEDVPFFGDNAALLTSLWVPFIERYRVWERFVKYTRILRRSNSPVAQNILNMARAPTVLNVDIDNVEEGWTRAMTRGSETELTPRTGSTITYPIVSGAPEMAQIPGHPPPDLCPLCIVKFKDMLSSFKDDSFHAIPGLPTRVTTCTAVARAAAIRRVALYASGDACCDKCASKIGRWADIAGYMVCGAVMEFESTTSAPDWLLQCYAVWSATITPMSAITVLSVFDLLCDVKCEDGAMGRRDVLEVWEAEKNNTSSFKHGN